MNPFSALEKAWNAGIAWSRRHSRLFNHAWLARQRYNDVLGGRLAAAIAYYGFFAVFALALVAYSVVGYVLANSPAAVDAVNRFLKQNIPFLNAAQIAEERTTVAIIGLIGLVVTGVGWIESMRSSQRAIWRFKQQPGNFIIRRLLDLAIMIGIGLLLGLSLWVQAGINDVIKSLLPGTAGVIGIVLSLMINALLAASLLTGVSRLRMSMSRLIPSTLLVAIGLSVLSTVGRLYINYSMHRPAFRVVGGTVALLVFLYLFNQLLLYGAALAATSTRGEVVDLAAEAPPAGGGDESEGTDDRPPGDTTTRDTRPGSDTSPPIGADRAGDRSDGDRLAEDRPDGGRSDGGRSDGGRSDGDRSDGDRSDGGRSDGGRPAGDRPAGARDRRR